MSGGQKKKKKAVSNYTDGCCFGAAVNDTADGEEGGGARIGVTAPDDRLCHDVSFLLKVRCAAVCLDGKELRVKGAKS